MDINLTQEEANALIAMEKHVIDPSKEWEYPDLGGSISIPLQSLDRHEQFLLDLSRGRIDLLKGKFQDRARQAVVLVRLDFGGAPHRNPDGAEVACPHLHIYRENYGDKWADPVPSSFLACGTTSFDMLNAFMDYCAIRSKPNINRGLFT